MATKQSTLRERAARCMGYLPPEVENSDEAKVKYGDDHASYEIHWRDGRVDTFKLPDPENNAADLEWLKAEARSLGLTICCSDKVECFCVTVHYRAALRSHVCKDHDGTGKDIGRAERLAMTTALVEAMEAISGN